MEKKIHRRLERDSNPRPPAYSSRHLNRPPSLPDDDRPARILCSSGFCDIYRLINNKLFNFALHRRVYSTVHSVLSECHWYLAIYVENKPGYTFYHKVIKRQSRIYYVLVSETLGYQLKHFYWFFRSVGSQCSNCPFWLSNHSHWKKKISL